MIRSLVALALSFGLMAASPSMAQDLFPGANLDPAVPAPETSGSVLGSNAVRMLEAIENLPDEEREVFELIRIQGITQSEAAELAVGTGGLVALVLVVSFLD